MKKLEVNINDCKNVIEAMGVLHAIGNCFCDFNGAILESTDTIKEAYSKLESIYGKYISIPNAYK